METVFGKLIALVIVALMLYGISCVINRILK